MQQAAFVFVALAVFAGPALAQDDRDWPCVQRLVPEISEAVIWAGPPTAGLDEDWHRQPGIAELVVRLSSPSVSVEAAEAEIEQFAANLPADRRNQRLTLLFAGVLETMNQDRSNLIRGIKRYSRGQADRARNLSALLDEMVRLEDDPDAAAQERLARIRQEIEIRQRLFDERERSIEFLCNRPVVVEQKLGQLARSIAMHLD